MESLNLNVRVNASDKKNFEQFCSSVGMNVSTAINMFIKTVLREQKLPFEIKSDYNDYIDRKLEVAENQMETTDKRYSQEELLERLNNIISQYENNRNV